MTKRNRLRIGVTWICAAMVLVLVGCATGKGSGQPSPGDGKASPAKQEQGATNQSTPADAGAGIQAKAEPARDLSRLVTINGDITEIVYALGQGDRVVGNDTSSYYPEAANSLPKVGYGRTLSAEGILALKPTRVLGNQEAGPKEVLEQIRSAGVPVVLAPNPVSLQAPMVKIRAVAEALGIPEKGTALAGAVQTKIEQAQALAKRATSKPRVVFVYARGTQTLLVAGTDTSAHVLIEAAGGVNAGSAAEISGYKPLTPEALAKAQPDLFLLLEKGLESLGGIDGLLKIPGVLQTPAGQQRRVVALDDLYLLGMGPRTGDALMDLVKLLHPELSGGR